jgi:hypothetical protein
VVPDNSSISMETARAVVLTKCQMELDAMSQLVMTDQLSAHKDR